MAHKDRSVQITAYIDEDSDLHEDLQDWRENYNSQSEAVKEAMKRGLDDSSDVDYVLRGLWIGLTVLLALMLGQIGFVAGWTVTGLLVFAVLAVFAVGLNVPFERLLE